MRNELLEKYNECMLRANYLTLMRFVFEHDCVYYISFFIKGSWTEPEEIDFIK
jgi:hypothetical protein